MQIQRLPTFFKHRDNNFFPTWTYILPISITRIPASLLEATIFTLVSYFAVPLSIDAGRCAGSTFNSLACARHSSKRNSLCPYMPRCRWSGAEFLALLRRQGTFQQAIETSTAAACRFFLNWLVLFLLHNMAITQFRTVGALTRNIVVANACGSLTLLLTLMMGGFVIPKPNVRACLHTEPKDHLSLPDAHR